MQYLPLYDTLFATVNFFYTIVHLCHQIIINAGRHLGGDDVAVCDRRRQGGWNEDGVLMYQ